MEALQLDFGGSLHDPVIAKRVKRRRSKTIQAKPEISAEIQGAFLYMDTNDVEILKDWIEDVGVDAAHQELLFTNLELLRDCKRNSKTWNDLSYWVLKPYTKENVPFSFATCCRVIGMDDIEDMQVKIFKILESHVNKFSNHK